MHKFINLVLAGYHEAIMGSLSSTGFLYGAPREKKCPPAKSKGLIHARDLAKVTDHKCSVFMTLNGSKFQGINYSHSYLYSAWLLNYLL